MNQYEVCGRQLKGAQPDSEIYKMTIFAPNEIIAQSRFWYFMNSLQRVKRSNGQLVSCKLIEESDEDVKTYGISIRYRTQVGHQNQYREVRETTASRAMAKLFSVMAGQYRIRYHDIQIIKFSVVANEDVKRHTTMDVIPHEHHNNGTVFFPHYHPKAELIRQSKRQVFARKE